MSKEVIDLFEWSVKEDFNPYRAPELGTQRFLQGIRSTDNKLVSTSTIAKADGRLITTRSGSVYRLNDIDPNYWKWLEDNNIEYDYENPIKIK